MSIINEASRGQISVDRTSSTPRRPARSSATAWGPAYAARLRVTDLGSVLLAAVAVHLIRLQDGADPAGVPYAWLTALIAVAWLAALSIGDSRDRRVIGFGADEYKRVIQASVALAGLIAIVSYAFELSLPRSYLVLMMPIGLALLLTTRYVARRQLHRKRDFGHMSSRVLAVGDQRAVRELMKELSRAPRAGYRIVGACVNVQAGGQLPTDLDGLPIVGNLDHVAGAARQLGVDAVAVTSTAAFGPAQVRKLSWELEGTETDLILAPALTNIAGPRVHTAPVAGLPLIHVESPTYRGANRLAKRTFDLVGSLLLIAVLAPVLVAVAVAVKFSSRGGVFFTQRRVGLNGRDFKMIKFRSMVVDAEAKLAVLRASQQDAGNETMFKMKNDPRVTSVGRFIRRFSLDELPQLFNVVKGDMSLVGPRPPLLAEVEKYGDDARLRLLVKPGMTGLWQVSGRSDLSWEETVRLDVYYVENWSITSDLVILWKTAKAVGGSGGAY